MGKRAARRAVLLTGAICAAALLGSTASTALAGGMDSGGGLLLKDSVNPWFMQNTPVVKYCLAVDAQQFHLDPAVADQRIQEAVAYWEAELAKGQIHYGRGGDAILVGTQTFVSEPCSASTDLVFQLGSLTPAQQASVDSPDSTIALTVRTAYDRVNLRGRGFIYVAPDLGPDPAHPTARHDETFWSIGKGTNFRNAVTHELGHVFGMPDSGQANGLMSYTYVESLWGNPDEGYFARPLPDSIEVLQLDYDEGGYMGLPSPTVDRRSAFIEAVVGVKDRFGMNQPDVTYHIHDNVFEVVVRPQVGPDAGVAAVVGRAALIDDSADRDEASVTLWPPAEQTVYKALNPGDRIPLVMKTVRHVRGTYEVLATHRQTPISIALDPDRPLRVLGFVDGKLVANILYPDAADL